MNEIDDSSGLYWTPLDQVEDSIQEEVWKTKKTKKTRKIRKMKWNEVV